MIEGLGAFLSSGDTRGARDPIALGELAEDLLEARIRTALVCVRSYDRGRLIDVDEAVEIARGMRGFGIDVGAWSFPTPVDGAVAGRELGRIAKAIRAPLALFDAEDPDGAGPLDWTEEQAIAMRDGLVDEVDEHTEPGVTAYPGMRGFGLPWPELAFGVGVPQIYGTADDQRAAWATVERYRAVHGRVYPATSLRTPGRPSDRPTPARVVKRLEAITRDPRTGMLGVRAALIWSSTLLRKSRPHRLAIGQWAHDNGW